MSNNETKNETKYSNNEAFIKAVQASELSAKEKFSIVHDFHSVTTDAMYQDKLKHYRQELLNEINKNIMSEKHPAFAQYFLAIK